MKERPQSQLPRSMVRILSIQGFKSIHEERIELGRVNCFIGANGVGKSNVLEAMGLLGAAANGVVDDESLLRRGVRPGLPRLYKSSFASERTPSHIGLGLEGEQGEAYRVSLLNPLESPEPAWSFKTEKLTDGREEIVSDGVRNKKNLNPKAGLAALKQVDLNPDNAAARLMGKLQSYAIYCPNTPTLRGIVPDMQSRQPAGLNGGQLAEGFALLRRHLESGGEEGLAMLDQVLELIDWVDDVQTTSHGASLVSAKVPRTRLMLKFTDRFMNRSRNELTAYDASEGALYILFSAILCLLPQAPVIFAIDNLDQALNPRLLARMTARLSGWLHHSGPDRQLLFTVHNPAVLDGLDLDDPETRLFAVERTSHGLTRVRRILPDSRLQALHASIPFHGSGSWGIWEPSPMSELHIALVAEGPTDKEIIEAALGAVLEKSRPFILTLIPPEPTRPSFGGGWGGVLKWCHDTRLRHTETLDDDPTLSLFDLVIIHLDVDVATFRYADCGPEVMDLARQMAWHPLPCNQLCPPVLSTVEQLENMLESWLGRVKKGNKTLLCMPAQSSGTWLAAAILESDFIKPVELQKYSFEGVPMLFFPHFP